MSRWPSPPLCPALMVKTCFCCQPVDWLAWTQCVFSSLGHVWRGTPRVRIGPQRLGAALPAARFLPQPRRPSPEGLGYTLGGLTRALMGHGRGLGRPGGLPQRTPGQCKLGRASANLPPRHLSEWSDDRAPACGSWGTLPCARRVTSPANPPSLHTLLTTAIPTHMSLPRERTV